ncbi:DinB family protein [Cyclobacterium xiamenense]|jgi:uncharacterized damage-inducible protein DinB|uniref:DinB family protein n=1 Tax=Cyclobacterium xiamenense TaxID=1297121 RepID=UPI0012B81A4F|nr:DinB family protein [Cyclobacterium xiamenense]
MSKPEVWLRGPIPDIPFLLQPAAHALLQTLEEVPACLQDFPEERLWERTAGRASVGFHLLHLAGVLDRLLTYADGKQLNEAQLEYLQRESKPHPDLSSESLVYRFEQKVLETLEIFKRSSEPTLRQSRLVGRKKLPSTVLGLYFHAAEHSQRHLGQLLVTATVLKTRQAPSGE